MPGRQTIPSTQVIQPCPRTWCRWPRNWRCWRSFNN